jgi:hypothetical protein
MGNVPVVPPVYGQPQPSGGKGSKKMLVVAVIIIVLLALLAGASALLLGHTPKVDEKTFEKDFQTCKKAINYAAKDSEFGGDSSAKINGKKDKGCSVTIKFGSKVSGSEATLSDKDFTCILDNSTDFNSALEAALSDPTKYSCKGSAIDALKKLNGDTSSDTTSGSSTSGSTTADDNTSEARDAGHLVLSEAQVYAVDHKDAQPTRISQIKLPSYANVTFAKAPLTSAPSNPSTVEYYVCGSNYSLYNSLSKVGYWDYAANKVVYIYSLLEKYTKNCRLVTS